MATKVGKMVCVTWEDAWASDDYWTMDEIQASKPYLVDTVGVCVRDDKQFIATSRTVLHPPTERFRTVHVIPRAMVKKVRVLK